MPVLRLTKRTIDNLKPGDKRFVAFDASLPGFGVKVMPSGTKSFVLEYRPHGGGRGIAKRRLTLARYGTATVEQARSAALDALARIRLGADPMAEKADRRATLTVLGLIDAFWQEHVALKCKASTAENHKAALERLREAHGAVKSEALTRSHLAALHGRIRDCPYAANRFLAVVSKMFAWAAMRGLVLEGHNPAARIEHYREARRERFLSADEIARLGDALREAGTLDPFAIAAIRLLILTGARLREILHARWGQVDFERGMLFLDDSKTGAKPVYLNAAALQVLTSMPRLEGNPHISGGKAAQPRSGLKRPWAAITNAAGLDGLRIHDLRHSYASIGAGASLGLPIIGKLLGHSQPATTQRYAHLADDPVRRAAEAIGATIGAVLDGKSGTVTPLTRRPA